METLQHPYFRAGSQAFAILTSIKSHALDGFTYLNHDSELINRSQISQNLALSLSHGSPHFLPKDKIIRGNLAFYEQSKPEQFKLDSMTTDMSSFPAGKHKVQDISPVSSIPLQRNNIGRRASSQLSIEQRSGSNRDRFSSFRAQPLLRTKITEVNNDGETPLKVELKVEGCFDFNQQGIPEEFNVEDDENCKVHFFIEQMKVQPQPTIRSK